MNGNHDASIVCGREGGWGLQEEGRWLKRGLAWGAQRSIKAAGGGYFQPALSKHGQETDGKQGMCT